ncbi:MAG: tetratricopeptide repeat protein [Candidatus Acidiferrales bacterium]
MKIARRQTLQIPSVAARRLLPALAALGIGLSVAFAATTARAGGAQIAPEAAQAIEKMYGGDPDGAIALLHTYEAAHPDDPLPFTIEAEARWWKMYCDAAEIKWGMVDSQKRGKRPEDESYFALADHVIQLAEAQIARNDTSQNHLYAAIGYALKTRLYGLRNENRVAAHNGVAARTEFLHALELDPNNADAEAGIGFYNYYVDTLSPIVKFLRFFMGIPGGNKQEGERQIRVAAEHGVLLAVDARFYLARNLRTYEQQYQEALTVAEPLATRYPQNPIFLLLIGNLNVELGRKAKAAEYFNAVLNLPAPSSATSCCSGCSGPSCKNPCAAHVRTLANSFLESIRQ